MAKKKEAAQSQTVLPSLRVDTETWDKIERTRERLSRRIDQPRFKRADAIRWLLTQAKEPT